MSANPEPCVRDLSTIVQNELSKLFNQPDSLGRDWRQLMAALNLRRFESIYSQVSDPTKAVLTGAKNHTISQLCEMFLGIGREDAVMIILEDSANLASSSSSASASSSALSSLSSSRVPPVALPPPLPAPRVVAPLTFDDPPPVRLEKAISISPPPSLAGPKELVPLVSDEMGVLIGITISEYLPENRMAQGTVTCAGHQRPDIRVYIFTSDSIHGTTPLYISLNQYNGAITRCHNHRCTGVTWTLDWSVPNIDVFGQKSLIAVAVVADNDVRFKQSIDGIDVVTKSQVNSLDTVTRRLIYHLPNKFCVTSAPWKIPEITRPSPLLRITDLNFDRISSEQLLSGVVESREPPEFKVFVLVGSDDHNYGVDGGLYYLQGGNGISCQTWPSTSNNGGRTWRTQWCMRPVEIKSNHSVLIAVAVPAVTADAYRLWLRNHVSGRRLENNIHCCLEIPPDGILLRMSTPDRFRQPPAVSPPINAMIVSHPAQPPRFPLNWQAELIKHEDGPGGCVICTEFKADASLKPCHHLCLCMRCAKKVLNDAGTTCPICKTQVSHVEGQHLT
jgi:hypothetical protein